MFSWRLSCRNQDKDTINSGLDTNSILRDRILIFLFIFIFFFMLHMLSRNFPGYLKQEEINVTYDFEI